MRGQAHSRHVGKGGGASVRTRGQGLAGRLAAAAVALPAVLLAAAVEAETLVAARTIRSQAVLTAADLAFGSEAVPGALADPGDALGMEARVVLYAGRPIRAADLAPPALVERNQIVALSYRAGPLIITTEGRALARAGAGEAIRVMNLASRATVTGTVGADGVVRVAGGGS